MSPTEERCRPSRAARGHRLAAVLLGLGSLAALPAWAEGGLLLLDPVPATPTLSYGGTAFFYPRYPGSAQQALLPIPAFEWLDPSGLFVSTDVGVGWNLSRRADVQWGLRLWPELPRRAADGGRLRGLPEIPLRIERTLFANWSPVEFAQLQSALRTGLGPDQRGTLLEAGVSAGAPLRPGLLVGLTIGMSWANGAYRQAWFGLDPRSAAALGRPPFHAGAGWQDLQTAVGAEWTVTDRWRLVVRSEQWRLLGAAAASPLTESRWQHGLTLSLWHDL